MPSQTCHKNGTVSSCDSSTSEATALQAEVQRCQCNSKLVLTLELIITVSLASRYVRETCDIHHRFIYLKLPAP